LTVHPLTVMDCMLMTYTPGGLAAWGKVKVPVGLEVPVREPGDPGVRVKLKVVLTPGSRPLAVKTTESPWQILESETAKLLKVGFGNAIKVSTMAGGKTTQPMESVTLTSWYPVVTRGLIGMS